MLTRGTTDHASTPSSPGSKVDSAPSGNEPTTAPSAVSAVAPAVVDVIGMDDSWATTPMRRTSEPAPLRVRKQAPPKEVSTEATRR
ncbi:hypothetical protein PR003_g26708 [Phytophthora rubi]|uniref:Uncharacterized protein n=1 Tax=Phytophthora rubi TaxID=129364 RepID=A0A6A3I833_9STRA|nr:hypothetical protein PR001_g25417 [Phytophthora rubi]KAE9284996.1 hypothetical protein PR003_g26708 [Phytophthora rubi]